MSSKIFNVQNDIGAYLGNSSVLVHDRDGYGALLLPKISDGKFSFDMDDIAFEGLDISGLLFTASAPGYQTLTANFSDLSDTYTFTLSKSNVATYVLIGGAVVGLGIAIANMKKKKRTKKMSGFTDLTPQAQTAATVGIAAIVAYLVIFKGNRPSGQALADKAAGDLQTLAAAGMHPTLSPSQAESYAGILRTAFDDCGTDEDAINSVMNNLSNDADIALLLSTYGTRPYKGCFDGDFFSTHSFNLAEAMTSELSSNAIAYINASFASRGINFKF